MRNIINNRFPMTNEMTATQRKTKGNTQSASSSSKQTANMDTWTSSVNSNTITVEKTLHQDVDLDSLRRQMEVAKKQAKQEEDKLEVMLTCMEIFRRLSGGDNVPAADHKYLMKHDAALYAKAITMRFPKQDPTEYEQLSEDENKQDHLTNTNPEENNASQSIGIDLNEIAGID